MTTMTAVACPDPDDQPDNETFHVWERGPYYFEIRDTLTGDYVDIKVGADARQAAETECARRNMLVGGIPDFGKSYAGKAVLLAEVLEKCRRGWRLDITDTKPAPTRED